MYEIFLVFISSIKQSVSITCQQNDYLSINGHQKTKEMSKFKKINFKTGIGIERCMQFTTVILIMKKVPKQDEQVSLLRIWDYKL